jgi:hypothetical protein
VGHNGVMNVQRFTVYAFGTKVGDIPDPTGDDNGPGSYLYPSDGAFNPGSFDLTGLDVYEDGDTIRFVVSTAAEIRNPWGGNGMSTQRVNIYLSDGPSATSTPLLPGTNTSAAGAWRYAVVADGRNDASRFGGGTYNADLVRVSGAALTVIPSGKIISSVPADALDGLDLRTAGYQVSMFSAAEDGEGIGNVRPIYSTRCWQGTGCPSFVGPYRGGGGAGDWTDANQARDTDTSDSNAFDVITAATNQATAMDWTRGPVILPYVALAKSEDADVTVTTRTGCLADKAYIAVRAKNTSNKPVSITLSTSYGTMTFPHVKPGANAERSFAARATSIDAGIATVTTTTTRPNPANSTTSHSPYSGYSC